MQGLGAIVFDPVDIPSAAEWHGSMHSMVPNEVAIIAHEFKEDLADYLGTMKTTEVRCLGELRLSEYMVQGKLRLLYY